MQILPVHIEKEITPDDNLSKIIINSTDIDDGDNDIKLFDVSGLGIAYRAQDLVKDLATTTLEEKDLSKIIDIINKHFKLQL